MGAGHLTIKDANDLLAIEQEMAKHIGPTNARVLALWVGGMDERLTASETAIAALWWTPAPKPTIAAEYPDGPTVANALAYLKSKAPKLHKLVLTEGASYHAAQDDIDDKAASEDAAELVKSVAVDVVETVETVAKVASFGAGAALVLLGALLIITYTPTRAG